MAASARSAAAPAAAWSFLIGHLFSAAGRCLRDLPETQTLNGAQLARLVANGLPGSLAG
jgi:hypothetical protein